MKLKLKFKTLVILIISMARYFLFGPAVRRNDPIRKVVIFHGGKLGDMICATPVFRAIKEAYPACAVVVVGNATNKVTLEHNPDVDNYIVESEDVFRTIESIRREGADFGCILAPGTFGLAALYLSGIPLIAAPRLREGWSPFETRTYKLLSHFVVTRDYRKGNYMPREYLKMLEPIGITTHTTKKYIFWSREADASAERMISSAAAGHVRIGIMPGAGNKIKQWPAERFAEVADHFIERHGAFIFVIGNESNRSEIDTMTSLIRNKDHMSDCSRISLDEVKALIAKMQMTISVDTGPIFIAEASGIPTIDIGGVIHPKDMAPNDGEKHILITYEGEPLLWSLNSRVYDYEKARAGILSITVDDVIREAEKLLTRIG